MEERTAVEGLIAAYRAIREIGFDRKEEGLVTFDGGNEIDRNMDASYGDS